MNQAIAAVSHNLEIYAQMLVLQCTLKNNFFDIKIGSWVAYTSIFSPRN